MATRLAPFSAYSLLDGPASAVSSTTFCNVTRRSAVTGLSPSLTCTVTS